MSRNQMTIKTNKEREGTRRNRRGSGTSERTPSRVTRTCTGSTPTCHALSRKHLDVSVRNVLLVKVCQSTNQGRNASRCCFFVQATPWRHAWCTKRVTAPLPFLFFLLLQSPQESLLALRQPSVQISARARFSDEPQGRGGLKQTEETHHIRVALKVCKRHKEV